MNKQYRNGNNCLCICGTAYSLMNILNLVIGENINYDTFDLIVFIRSKEMMPAVEKIKQMNVFRMVAIYRFVDELDATNKARLFLLPNTELKKYLINSDNIISRQYSCTVSQSIFYLLLFGRITRTGSRYLIDEGMSSYTGRTVSSEKRSPIARIMMGRNIDRFIEGEYLNEPSLYMGNNTSLKLIKIRSMNDKTRELIHNIFDAPFEATDYSRDFLYIGTAVDRLKNLMVNSNDNEDITKNRAVEILKNLFETVGKKNIVYRMHPIESIYDVQQYGVDYMYPEDSWEVLLNKIDVNNIIIVSFFSTAAFTPKLLYGHEPNLVFLYKLFDSDFYNADAIIEGMREIYDDSNRIFVPENTEEMKEIILNLGNLHE